MRKKIVAGNWKMNLDLSSATDLAKSISSESIPDNTEVVLCSPFPFLVPIIQSTKETPHVYVGAQNCHQEEKGAYTGEVAASMLHSCGVDYVILGHSERRSYFKEDDALLAAKVRKALEAGLKVIFCCGELLEQRKGEQQIQVVRTQLENGLFHCTAEEMESIVIAYEPVWAIGTGLTATPDQAQEMHQAIRSMLDSKYGTKIAQSTCILYGGSCKPGNAAEIFAQEDVDGGLIGGASLKADDFLSIIRA